MEAQHTIARRARDFDTRRGELVEAAVVLHVRNTRVRARVLRDTLGDVGDVALRLFGGDVDAHAPCAAADLGKDLSEEAGALADVCLAGLGEDGDHGGDGGEGVEVHLDERGVVFGNGGWC
jgi:hypothetical protein